MTFQRQQRLLVFCLVIFLLWMDHVHSMRMTNDDDEQQQQHNKHKHKQHGNENQSEDDHDDETTLQVNDLQCHHQSTTTTTMMMMMDDHNHPKYIQWDCSFAMTVPYSSWDTENNNYIYHPKNDKTFDKTQTAQQVFCPLSDSNRCIQVTVQMITNPYRKNDDESEGNEIDNDDHDDEEYEEEEEEEVYYYHHHHHHHQPEDKHIQDPPIDIADTRALGYPNQKVKDENIALGIATYKPPFMEQYGRTVAQILQRRPVQPMPTTLMAATTETIATTTSHPLTTTATATTTTTTTNELDNIVDSHVEWANWLYELGMAHATVNDGSDVDWQEMILAINAYELAWKQFYPNQQQQQPQQHKDDNIPPLPHDQQFFVASVHFQLGEVYLLHPEGSMTEQAKQEFQIAHDMYHSLRQRSPHQDFDRLDLDLRWADTCNRLGVLYLSSVNYYYYGQEQPLFDWLLSPAFGGIVSGKGEGRNNHHGADTTNPSMEFSSQIQQAQALLQESIQVYREVVEQQQQQQQQSSDEDNDETSLELIATWLSLASTVHNAASTAALAGNLQQSLDYMLESLELYQTHILDTASEESVEHQTAKISAADLLLSLSDTNLQMGNYDDAKKYYQQALEWYEENDIEVAPMQQILQEDEDATLEQQEAILQEYQDMVYGNKKNKKHRHHPGEIKPQGLQEDDFEYYYEQDDRYEGDLYAALGGLYLNRDEAERATAYLLKAVNLYNKNQDESLRQMADAKLNLAMAYFRSRNFQKSLKTHLEALDIYRSLYGDGVNPLLQDLETLTEAFMQRPEQQAGETTAGDDVDAPRQGVRQPRIDLEMFKQSIKNATETAERIKETSDEL